MHRKSALENSHTRKKKSRKAQNIKIQIPEKKNGLGTDLLKGLYSENFFLSNLPHPQ